jgi:DNA-binding NarL/FixJ family response regulator
MTSSQLEDAFQAGATAVISKEMEPYALGTLIYATFSNKVVNQYRPDADLNAEPDCQLTLRELEVLSLVAQGYTNGIIARKLWVTEHTVKFHLSKTYQKLGVTNRTEASRHALKNGWTKA